MFECTVNGCEHNLKLRRGEFICEECFRSRRHPQNHLIKHYKHCIMREAISPQISRRICRCTTVPHADPNGNYVSLFPVDDQAPHRGYDDPTVLRCGLMGLNEIVAGAKFEGLLSEIEKREKFDQLRQEAEAKKRVEELEKAKRKAQLKKRYLDRDPNIYRVRTDETIIKSADQDKDIPFFVKKTTDRYPFGNVHLGLMVGPLIIENGVK